MIFFIIFAKLLYEASKKANHVNTRNPFADSMWAQQIHEQMCRDAETARMASTGIEFGGFNCDPSLNPGMTDPGIF